MGKQAGQPKPEKMPTFASEDEERHFWDEHDPSLYFTEPADVIVRLKSGRKKMVSVRIDEALYDELKTVAAEHGLPYQRLMRELLRQALGSLASKGSRSAKV
jgi:predicted DNA binding CopG/RHH family protein